MESSLKEKIIILVIGIIFTAIAVFGVVSYVKYHDGQGNISDKQLTSIENQLIAKDDYYSEKMCANYLPDKWIDSLKVYGTRNNGKYTFLYVESIACEYIKFKGTIYTNPGGVTFYKLKVNLNGKTPKLISISEEESGDTSLGEMLSLADLFPFKYAVSAYSDIENDTAYLNVYKQMDAEISKEWNAKVNSDLILDVDGDTGEYALWKNEHTTISKGTLPKIK